MKHERIYGLHAVRHALAGAPAVAERLWVRTGARARPALRVVLELAARAGVPVVERDLPALDRLAGGGRHQGAVLQRRATGGGGGGDSLPQLLALLRAHGAGATVLALDGVQDPRNLGACLRVADAAGAAAVVAPRRRAAALTPAARKVACGGAEAVPLFRVPNLAGALRRLGEHGLWIVGLAAGAPQSLYAWQPADSLVLVLGGEGKGLGRTVRGRCDELVGIPLAGRVESLNVAVAAGIALYHAARHRAAAPAGAAASH